jgi:putative endonuclease
MRRLFSKNKADCSHLEKGARAEKLACSYLRKQGMVLLTSNYHCRLGEIDLVMQDADQMVFVEVKYRQRQDYGSALEQVTPQKQRKLILAAQHYLHTAQMSTIPSCRFDVISITPATGKKPKITWIKHAFEAN